MVRFQLSRNFLSNAPFIHCLYVIYARKNYATVELGLPVYLLIPQSELVQSHLYLKTTHWFPLVAPSTLIEVWRESLRFWGEVKKNSKTYVFFNSPLFIIDFSPLAHTPKQGRVVSGDVRYGIVHFKNSRENGYKLWAQWFLGSFRWTSVSYDWWMVFKATINQSTCKPKQSQKSLPARTLVRILLIVSGMRNFGSSVAGTQSDSKSPHLGSSQVNSSSACG